MEGHKISISVCISDLREGRFYVGANGKKYANLDVVSRKEPDQWGKTHFIKESLTAAEIALDKDKRPADNFVGNGKYFAFGSPSKSGGTSKQASTAYQGGFEDDGDMPF